jgi:hypothetical protein
VRRLHVRNARDVIEVFAILLAGAWALYVFVYENNVRPTLAPPSPVFTVEMHHVGNDGPLAVVRIDETIHNVGTVRVHFTGYSVTVFGMRIRPQAHPEVTTLASDGGTNYVYSDFGVRHVVYRYVMLTTLGDAKSPKDLFVEPGANVSFSDEFYVPRSDFDRLQAWLVGAFTKNDNHPVPTSIAFGRTGLPDFKSNDPDLEIYKVPIAQLDLKAE